jgi:hypothetical protein
LISSWDIFESWPNLLLSGIPNDIWVISDASFKIKGWHHHWSKERWLALSAEGWEKRW